VLLLRGGIYQSRKITPINGHSFSKIRLGLFILVQEVLVDCESHNIIISAPIHSTYVHILPEGRSSIPSEKGIVCV